MSLPEYKKRFHRSLVSQIKDKDHKAMSRMQMSIQGEDRTGSTSKSIMVGQRRSLGRNMGPVTRSAAGKLAAGQHSTASMKHTKTVTSSARTLKSIHGNITI